MKRHTTVAVVTWRGGRGSMALWALWGAAHAKDERKRVSSRVAALAAKGGGEGRGSTEGGLVQRLFCRSCIRNSTIPPFICVGHHHGQCLAIDAVVHITSQNALDVTIQHLWK
jgi:hypothetical protein